jgi:hypothetical protein
VSVEALLVSVAIDTKEWRDVATTDVEGAYLHTDMDKEVIMVFEGNMVDYMVQANPKRYGPHVHTTKNGKKLLDVESLKALYGCIKSTLLWYNLFTEALKGMGFILKPYDTCVANKVTHGKQCTIYWYVDDLKISHVDPSVVDGVIAKIEKRLGKMVVTRGSKHTYVGMDIHFTGDGEAGEAKILMAEYVEELISAFPEDCSKTPGRQPPPTSSK